MNKTILKTVSTLMLLTIVGCSNVTSSSSTSTSTSSNSNNTESTSSNKDNLLLKEMLDEISDPNITYHSDYYLYYYYIGEEDEVFQTQRFDVFAKITEELYDMKAYEYGTNRIASSAHLEKDSDGHVSYSEINIRNELVTQKAIDGSNNIFLWEESVYFNLIKYLDANDFSLNEDGSYSYTQDLEGLPLNIIHTAIPVSYFFLESFTINVEDGEIVSFVFQEEESDQAYEGCMYGRKLTITFEDVGTTEIERIAPYENKEENDDLSAALSFIKSKTNYTIDSKAIFEDGSSIDLYETFLTDNDIYQNQYVDGETIPTGLHTYDGELYTFDKVDEYLLGKKVGENVNISSYIPTFDFSEDVFNYIGEEEGYKVYSPFANMTEVLNYIDVFNQHQGSYFYPAGEVYFFVKDGKLSKIEFPVAYSSTTNAIAIQQINYLDFDNTTIESNKWDSFVTKLPSTGAISWSDEEYLIELFDSDTEEVLKTMTLGELFEKAFGSSDSVPYFVEDGMLLDSYFNYSETDNRVYGSIEINGSVSSTFRKDIKTSFVDAGFTFKGLDMMTDAYRKDGAEIGFVYLEEGVIMVELEFPVGTILD